MDSEIKSGNAQLKVRMFELYGQPGELFEFEGPVLSMTLEDREGMGVIIVEIAQRFTSIEEVRKKCQQTQS